MASLPEPGIFKVSRKTLDGTWQEFEFPVKGKKFLVKNFSDGDIYVDVRSTPGEDESLLIPSQVAQVVLMNEISHFGFNKIKVKGAGTGDVEVQVVSY